MFTNIFDIDALNLFFTIFIFLLKFLVKLCIISGMLIYMKYINHRGSMIYFNYNNGIFIY